jgi:Tfp pilus assembly protein PilF
MIDYRDRSYAYEQTGDYVRAFADLNEAIQLEPRDSILYLNRARLYGRSGRSKKRKRTWIKPLT